MRKFEYQTLDIDTKKVDANRIQEVCNEMGEEGWELVNFLTQPQGIMLVFKKEQPRPFEDGAQRKPFAGNKSDRRPSFDSKSKTDFKPRSGDFKPRNGDSRSRSGDFKSRSGDSKPRNDKPLFKADRTRKFDN